MIVESLRAEDMVGFEADARMGLKLPGVSEAEAWGVLADKDRGWAWSVRRQSGEMAGACGLYLYDEDEPSHAEMWAVFSPRASALMLGVTRRTLAVLEASRGQLDHIQAHVARSFPQGKKWVLLLGFEPSGKRLEALDGVHDHYVWKG